MTNSTTKLLILLVLFFSITSIIPADDRTEPIDVFVVVDKSLSMEEEIGAVKNYINNSIVDEVLIPGDNFVLIAFYGKADVLLSEKVPPGKDDIEGRISQIQADGRFTDIGNALDTLKNSLEKFANDGRRKYLLLITDGVQEAPPESRYFSPDGSFNHEFLKNTKDIQKEGWKIQILGIGTATAAKEIAETLSGTYSEVPEGSTEQELADQTRDLLGVIEQSGSASLSPVGKSGRSSMKITLASSGYTASRAVLIAGITLQQPDGTEQSLLNAPLEFTIDPGETRNVDIPVQFESVPEPGTYSGNVIFTFGGDTPFSPAVTPITYRVKGFIGNNIWVIPVGAVVLALLVLSGLMIPRLLSGAGSISFVCTIDDGSVRKRQYKLKYSHKLYIVEGMMGLTVRDNPGKEAVAEITADGTGLHLTLLDEKGVKPADPIPDNVLPSEIVLVKKYGKKAKMSFSAA